MMTMPMRMLLLAIAGWVNEEQRAKIAFLEEQVRVYQEVHGRRPRFNNDQRRRLAAKGTYAERSTSSLTTTTSSVRTKASGTS